MKLYQYIIILSLLVLSTQTYAFDKKRSGFLLGIGIGLHDTDISDNSVPNQDIAQDESENGYAFSFRIGGGVNDQLLLYFGSDTNWYRERVNNEYTTVGLSGFGASYYFSPNTNTVYLTGLMGLSNRIQLTSSTASQDYEGTGFSFGVGYEFSNWLSFQFDYMNLNMEANTDRSYTKDVDAFRMTFQANFY